MSVRPRSRPRAHLFLAFLAVVVVALPAGCGRGGLRQAFLSFSSPSQEARGLWISPSGSLKQHPLRKVALASSLSQQGPQYQKKLIDEELRGNMTEILSVWGRRLDFTEYADSLLPRNSSSRVNEVVELVQAQANKVFVDCKVSLIGSCKRQVNNKFFSDVDFHIYGTSMEKEREDFMNMLRYCPEVQPDSLVEGTKAIKFVACGLRVDVVFPDRLGKNEEQDRDDLISDLEDLYRECPGAVRAARVAKVLFRDLNGLNVEFCVNEIARRQPKLLDLFKSDETGLLLFREVVYEANKLNPDVMSCTLERLKQMARSVPGSFFFEQIKVAAKQCQLVAAALVFLENSPLGEDLNNMTLDKYLIEYGLLRREIGNDPARMNTKQVELLPEISRSPGGPTFRISGRSAATDTEASRAQIANSSISTSAIPQPSVSTSLSGHGPVSSKKKTSAGRWGSFDGTMLERCFLIFDGMLYVIEKGLFAPATELERQFMTVWCQSADAFLEMATKKDKEARWRERTPPKDFVEVTQLANELGFESMDVTISMVESYQCGMPHWERSFLLAGLYWLRDKISAS